MINYLIENDGKLFRILYGCFKNEKLRFIIVGKGRF